MITPARYSGTMQLRTRGATKSLVETNTKGPAAGWPKLMETLRE
jgi:hypothetical protein